MTELESNNKKLKILLHNYFNPRDPNRFNKHIVIRFNQEHHFLNPELTLKSLQNEGYKISPHLHYNIKDKIRISLQNHTTS